MVELIAYAVEDFRYCARCGTKMHPDVVVRPGIDFASCPICYTQAVYYHTKEGEADLDLIANKLESAPVKMTDDDIDHETMSVRGLIAALKKLNPKDPIRATYDAGCASGDISGVERSDNDKEYRIIVE